VLLYASSYTRKLGSTLTVLATTILICTCSLLPESPFQIVSSTDEGGYIGRLDLFPQHAPPPNKKASSFRVEGEVKSKESEWGQSQGILKG